MYIANHAYAVRDLPLQEGQAELRALLEHATQPKYVCAVSWNDPGDLGKCFLSRLLGSSIPYHRISRLPCPVHREA